MCWLYRIHSKITFMSVLYEDGDGFQLYYDLPCLRRHRKTFLIVCSLVSVYKARGYT